VGSIMVQDIKLIKELANGWVVQDNLREKGRPENLRISYRFTLDQAISFRITAKTEEFGDIFELLYIGSAAKDISMQNTWRFIGLKDSFRFFSEDKVRIQNLAVEMTGLRKIMAAQGCKFDEWYGH